MGGAGERPRKGEVHRAIIVLWFSGSGAGLRWPHGEAALLAPAGHRRGAGRGQNQQEVRGRSGGGVRSDRGATIGQRGGGEKRGVGGDPAQRRAQLPRTRLSAGDAGRGREEERREETISEEQDEEPR